MTVSKPIVSLVPQVPGEGEKAKNNPIAASSPSKTARLLEELKTIPSEISSTAVVDSILVLKGLLYLEQILQRDNLHQLKKIYDIRRHNLRAYYHSI